MHKKIVIVLFIITILTFTIRVNATEIENNNNSRYRVIIEDDADLLTDQEEEELKKSMVPLTEFGNVLFKTTQNPNNMNSLKYIKNYYYSILKNDKGVAFYIDMSARQVCACATGGLDSIITTSKCNTIMDNVYTYAKKSQYLKCAEETFYEISTLLEGGRIAETMKYFCNAIISIMMGLFSTYGFYMIYATNRKATRKELIGECEVKLNYTPINVSKTGSHSVYSPVSDSSYGGSSGGGFSGGGSSGGSSGGGFSGSGGSHGF